MHGSLAGDEATEPSILASAFSIGRPPVETDVVMQISTAGPLCGTLQSCWLHRPRGQQTSHMTPVMHQVHCKVSHRLSLYASLCLSLILYLAFSPSLFLSPYHSVTCTHTHTHTHTHAHTHTVFSRLMGGVVLNDRWMLLRILLNIECHCTK